MVVRENVGWIMLVREGKEREVESREHVRMGGRGSAGSRFAWDQ